MSESLINIKMYFNYLVESNADMSNSASYKNELCLIRWFPAR